jgi:hypothetical protein
MTASIESLLAERTIYRNMVGFARAMDERDWTALEEFTRADMTADLGRGELVGRDNIVRFIRSFLDKCGATQHLLGNVIIDVDGTTAQSSADVIDMHLGSGEKAGLTFHTLGRYNDQWLKVDERWLMVRRVKENRGWVGALEIFGG